MASPAVRAAQTWRPSAVQPLRDRGERVGRPRSSARETVPRPAPTSGRWRSVGVEAERVPRGIEHHPNRLLRLVLGLFCSHLDGVRDSLLEVVDLDVEVARLRSPIDKRSGAGRSQGTQTALALAGPASGSGAIPDRGRRTSPESRLNSRCPRRCLGPVWPPSRNHSTGGGHHEETSRHRGCHRCPHVRRVHESGVGRGVAMQQHRQGLPSDVPPLTVGTTSTGALLIGERPRRICRGGVFAVKAGERTASNRTGRVTAGTSRVRTSARKANS